MNSFHNIIRGLLVLCCALGTLQGFGQGYFKLYPASEGNAGDGVQTADGGYLMTGVFQNGNIQKTDANGNVLWNTPNAFADGEGVAVCASIGGGGVAVGQNYTGAGGKKNIVVRVNASGAKQWQTVLPNNQMSNGIKSVAATSNGQYLACGITRDIDLSQQIWLVKLDAGGNILWNRALGQSDLSEQVARMIPLSDGNFAIVGDVLKAGNNRDFFIAKVDADGNLLWEKTYNKPLYQVAQDILESSNGDLIALGVNYQSDPSTPALLKTDAEGNELWYERPNISALYSANIPLASALCLVRDQADNLYMPLNSDFNGSSLTSTLFLLRFNNLGQYSDYIEMSNTEFVRRALLTSDNYLAFFGGNKTDQAFLLKTDLEGQLYSSRISGTVYDDANDNCQHDNGEIYFADYIVEARSSTGEKFFGKTNTIGQFGIRVADGDYQVIVHPKNSIAAFGVPCDTPSTNITGANQVIDLDPIGMQAAVKCPLMQVSMEGTRFRRCLPTIVSVDYCNAGNVAAQNVYVEIEKDPLLIYTGSTVPLTSQNGNVLRFNLNDDCGSFRIEFALSCDAVLGQNVCLDAHIYPDSNCLPPLAGWDGSRLEVRGRCQNGVEFQIINKGADMSEAADYVIIEDQIMFGNSLQLQAGKDTTIFIPNPSGHSYYLRVAQNPGNPGFGDPAAAVVGCGGVNGPNLAVQLPNQYDSESSTWLYCNEVVGSFDPNDKTGFPLGWKDEHLIEPGQEIKYVIRFQNTGNDTAFTVKILDRISEQLDLSSFQPGPASHKYEWSIVNGNTLSFIFSKILLPDSNVNVAASQGYVSFTMRPKGDLPLGTVVKNSADIYFDFNDPIKTNETRHQIGQPLVSLVQNPQESLFNLKATPNPFSDETQISFDSKGANEFSENNFILYDLQGRTVQSERFSGNTFLLKNKGLENGMYLFRLQRADGTSATGKLIVH